MAHDRLAVHGGDNVDRLVWPDDTAREVLYLHKLGAAPHCSERRLAHVMLQHAVQETMDRAIPCLKLDTATERLNLRHLYFPFGFTEVGEMQVGPYLVTLMRLSVIF